MKRLIFLLAITSLCSTLSVFGQQEEYVEYNGNEIKKQIIFAKVKSEYKQHCQATNINYAGLEHFTGLLAIDSYKQKFPQFKLVREDGSIKRVDLSLIYEIHYQKDIDIDAAIDILFKSGVFSDLEPFYIPRILYTPSDGEADPDTGQQRYHLKMANTFKAWNINKGDSNIVIGILDQGTNWDHEDMGNVKLNKLDPINGVDDDADGYKDNYRGWDFSDNDNDPKEYTTFNHGTYVAGTASAKTDNNLTTAGVGFNCMYIPLKIYPSFKGYDAVIYAAEHGYDIINLSWGCGNCYSSIVESIINSAVWDYDVVISAAAGNTDAYIDFYPASYDNALSVTGLDTAWNKRVAKTWSYNVDLCALSHLVWTPNNTSYGPFGGTSASAPIVAGVAGLVRKQFPTYNAEQIMQQLRVTANDTIYSLAANSPYHELLGTGAVDAYAAITNSSSPAVRCIDCKSLNSNGQSLTYGGDTVQFTGDFVNYLNATSNLQISISSMSPHTQMIDSVFSAGIVNTMDTTNNNSSPLTFLLDINTPINEDIFIRVGYYDSALNYNDYQYVKIRTNPDYIIVDENQLTMTINSVSNLGNWRNQNLGPGTRYKSNRNLQYEGGLILSADTNHVSNNLRMTNTTFNKSFLRTNQILESDTSSLADYVAHGLFSDSADSLNLSLPLDLEVSQTILAWNNPPDDKYIIIEYDIKNNGIDTINNLYAGLFSDWDIAQNFKDRADWDSAYGIGYAYDAIQKTTYMGIRLLTSQEPSYWAIDNSDTITGNPWGLYDGFTFLEKHRSISEHVKRAQAGFSHPLGTDISNVVGGTIKDLLPGESKVIAFAILAGDSLEDLQSSVIAAINKYPSAQLSSNVPIVNDDTICLGTSTILVPSGGQKFALYHNNYGNFPIDTGDVLQTPVVNKNTTFYISSLDSTIESVRTTVDINVYKPFVDFSSDPTDTLNLEKRNYVYFSSKAPEAISWSWDFGNNLSSNEINPSVVYYNSGIYIVNLKISDSAACENDTSHILVIVDSLLNGWSSQLNASNLSIFPNPVSSSLQINFASPFKANLLNVNGQIIKSAQSISNTATLDVMDFGSGIYYLELIAEGGDQFYHKIMITK